MAASAARGPVRHAVDASCSNRPGVGTRNECGTRARATTVPSSSAAIAFTDDVPMSIPTVTGRVSSLTRARATISSTASCSTTVRRHRVAAVGADDAAPVGDAAARLLDDRDQRARRPRVERPARPSRRRSPRPRACGPRSRRSRAGPRHARVSASNSGPAAVAPRTTARRRGRAARRRASATSDTAIGSPFAKAPPPRVAHQRRPSIGADTTPSTSSPSSSSAEQRRPRRRAPQVRLRAVDRVDDPAPRAARR